MKKVLFLMFLLLLMVLGTASVKAQVRIGGNGAPNAAAVLDLNATDTTNYGKKGLALPRVSLANVSTPLIGTPVVNGMMVYNINASTTGGSGVGIYYWNEIAWVKLAAAATPGYGSPATLTMYLDTTVTANMAVNPNITNVVSPRTRFGDICVAGIGTVELGAYAADGRIAVANHGGGGLVTFIIRCFRPAW